MDRNPFRSGTTSGLRPHSVQVAADQDYHLFRLFFRPELYLILTTYGSSPLMVPFSFDLLSHETRPKRGPPGPEPLESRAYEVYNT